MLPHVEGVLFDLGGTLIDYALPRWPGLVRRCVGGMMRLALRPEEEPLPPAAVVPGPAEAAARRASPPPETALPHRAAMGLRRVIRGMSGTTLPHFAEACMRPLVANGWVYRDARPTLRALQARGYRLGIISNTPWGTPEYLWESQVARFGLKPFFPVRLYSSSVGFRKPDARLFADALDRLDLAPDRALYVGDLFDVDVLGALEAGLEAAWLTRRRADPPGPAPRPYLHVRSLSDLLPHLPGPDAPGDGGPQNG